MFAISVNVISGDRLRAFSTACILKPSVYFDSFFFPLKLILEATTILTQGGIHCGSGLPLLNQKGDSLVIPAGSLDHPPDIKPNGNIFWADKALWYESGVAAAKCSDFQNE